MSLCPQCSKEFSCGMVEKKSGAPCWCAALPPLPVKGENGEIGRECYCPECLKRRLADERADKE